MTYYAGRAVSARISTLKISSDFAPTGTSLADDKKMQWEEDSIDSASSISVTDGVVTLPAGGHYHLTSYIGCQTGASAHCSHIELNPNYTVYQSRRSYAAKAVQLGYWADGDGVVVGVPWRVGYTRETYQPTISPAHEAGDIDVSGMLRGGESLQAEAVIETHEDSKTLEFLWGYRVFWRRTAANDYAYRNWQYTWQFPSTTLPFRCYTTRCLTVIREVPK